MAQHDPEAEDEPGDQAGHRSTDRFAIHVADAPHAETLFAEERPANLRAGVGHDERPPDEREDDGELLRAIDRRELSAKRDHDELECRPEGRDEQAVRAREHAVHDARLRAVERRRQKPIRVIKRQENPARHDGVEEVVLQEQCGEISRRVHADVGIEIEKAGHPERDEAAAATDHVHDTNAPFGVAAHELGDVERPSHSGRERFAALVLREPNDVSQEQRLDAPPDEPPQHVEEQDAEEDIGQPLPSDVIGGEEIRIASGCEQDAPEERQRRIEGEGTAEDAISGTAPRRDVDRWPDVGGNGDRGRRVRHGQSSPLRIGAG